MMLLLLQTCGLKKMVEEVVMKTEVVETMEETTKEAEATGEEVEKDQAMEEETTTRNGMQRP